MLDTYKIHSRIKEIRKRVLFLNEKFKHLSEKELTSDDIMNSAAEHNLQVAIQACLDIANHLVAALGLNRDFQTTGEVFHELSKKEIITPDFANIMVGVTGYRNILVHGYLDVSKKITYDNIQNHLSDLSLFAKYIEEFLSKSDTKR